MIIGALRDQVTFQRLTGTARDAVGNVTDGTWTAIATVWGQLKPGSGRENFESARLESAVMASLVVRATTTTRGITGADRVLIDGVPYNIRAVTNEDRRGRFLTMMVERGVG